MNINELKRRIIAVGAHKGGVGKTTISHVLATGLANQGYVVVLADLDAQAQVCDFLGVEHAPALFNMLVNNQATRDQLVDVSPEKWSIANPPRGKLYILPGDRTNQTVWRKCDDPLRLRDKLLALLDGGDIDYIILDTPPAISEDATAYLMAAGRIIIPTKTAYLTVRGVLNTLETIELLRNATRSMGADGANVEVIGIVPNLFNVKRSLHRQNLDALRAQFRDVVWPIVNDLTAFEESPQSHEAIWVYDLGSGTSNRARARAVKLLEAFTREIGA